MNSLLTAWLTEVAIITYRSMKQRGVSTSTPSSTGATATIHYPLPLPLPSEYVSTFLVFGALGLVPAPFDRTASLLGWGFVLATLLNLWVPGKANQRAASKPAVNPAGKGTAGPEGG